MRNRAERHLRAVKLAMDCAELGARVRTIHHLCGLPPRELQRLLFSDPYAIPRGRAPDSPVRGRRVTPPTSRGPQLRVRRPVAG